MFALFLTAAFIGFISCNPFINYQKQPQFIDHGGLVAPEDPYQQVDAKYRCCTPTKWEGKFCELGVTRSRHYRVGYADYSVMSYDGDDQKIAVDMHYVTKKHKGEAKFILNFKEKKMYIIYGSHCRVRTINFPFAPTCIKQEAKQVADTYIGYGAHHLDVTGYEYQKKSTDGKTDITVFTVVDKDCIPVHEGVIARLGSVGMIKDIAMFGITAGVKDPKVFDPPASCKKEDVDDDTLIVHDEMQEMIDYFINKFAE